MVLSYKSIFRSLYTICASVSCFFLILTAIVYIKLPELNNLHGKIIMSNVVTITLLTLYLLIVYNVTDYLSDTFCIIIGNVGYFLTMSMFTWMTVLSFDLFWTFCNARLLEDKIDSNRYLF